MRFTKLFGSSKEKKRQANEFQKTQELTNEVANNMQQANELTNELTNNKMQFTKEFQTILDRLAKNDPTLTSLNLGNNKIGVEGAKALARVLESNTTLSRLGLRYNNIGDEGAKALARVLESNTTLLELKLGNNNIGVEGAKALARVLKSNTTLLELNLWWNNIGVEGAKALARVLEFNTTLSILDLGSNNIGVEGTKALAQVLESNTTLSILSLRYNNIGVEGTKAILTALKDYNSTLKSIDLGTNGLWDSLRQQSYDLVKANNNGTRTDQARVEANRKKRMMDGENVTNKKKEAQQQTTVVEAAKRNPAEKRTEHQQQAGGQKKEEVLPEEAAAKQQEYQQGGQGGQTPLAQFETRAELDAKIASCATVRDKAFGSHDVDILKNAAVAEAELRKLEALRDNGGYPSISDLTQKQQLLVDQIGRCATIQERIPLAERLKQIKQHISREKEAAKKFGIQVDMMSKEVSHGRAAAVQKALESNDHDTTVEHVPMEYLAYITNDWSNIIGSGGFGTVYKGEDADSNMAVAIKTIHADKMDETESRNFETEIKVLSELRHPNIVRILGHSVSADKHCMVIEYAAGGSLFSIINDPLRRKELSPTGRLYVANALVGSLEYLHSKNVFHRDIKPENVCLREGWQQLPQVLLIDFGIASKIAKGAAHKTVTSNPGTLIYMAPEYLRPPYKYTAKSEVYSVGLVLMSLLQGTCFITMAADEYTEDTLLAALDASAGPWKANSDSDLAKLAIACVCHDPEQRPSVENLREQLKAIRVRMSAQLDPQITRRITAYQSRTRPSHLEEAGTAKHTCVRCGITRVDGGVLCSRNHFTCMAGMCLEETVRESMGSKTIQCCANKCSKTFILADTYGKIGADIYGQFLMTMDQMNDREDIRESIKKAFEEFKQTFQLGSNESPTNSTDLSKLLAGVQWNTPPSDPSIKASIDSLLRKADQNEKKQRKLERQMQQLLEKQERGADIRQGQQDLLEKMEQLSLQHAAGVAGMASGRLQCPRLCVLWPVRSKRGLSKLSLSNEYRLYFLCAHDRSPIKTSVVIKDTKKWIKSVAPWIKVAIIALRLVVTVYGVPLPALPDCIPGVGEEQLENALEQMSSLLEAEQLREMESWLDDCQDKIDSEHQWSELIASRESDISEEAYGAVVAEAYRKENRGWMNEMDISNKGTLFAWVKKANAAAWKNSGGV